MLTVERRCSGLLQQVSIVGHPLIIRLTQAVIGLQTAQGARNALVQVLVPATPCPQGVDSAGDR
jgi:hypothetical protein